MQRFFFVFLILFPLIVFSKIPNDTIKKSKEELLIRKVLDDQISAWNKGDFEQYMIGYWKSDSLRFIGKSGLKYGWQNTLNNYKKSYPDKASMGILKFDVLSVELFSSETAFVIGLWKLTRDAGNIDGVFSLVFKKINGQWLIVCDHSS
jgi:ketosteroid isomerase-like protein